MCWNLLKKLFVFPDLEISVALLNEAKLAEKLRTHCGKVAVFDEHKLSFPELLVAIRAFVREKPPQVIHSHRYKENILAFFSRGAGQRRACLVATQHGMPEPHLDRFLSSGHVVARLNRYLLKRRFDRVVAVSRDIRVNFVSALGFSSKRTAVIHNGIELPSLQPRFKAGPEMVVGSAGRLFPVKDYFLMVQIARELAGEERIFFTLAGDGPELTPLEAAIKEYGLTATFKLKGHVHDMDSFYSELDVYMNTSLHEGIPMAILEAMAHGLPVVAPKVGGIREIITDGVEGFLIPTRDPRDFAEKCLLFQKNPALREKMGLAARARIEEDFSAAAMAEQYRRLYHELAAG